MSTEEPPPEQGQAAPGGGGAERPAGPEAGSGPPEAAPTDPSAAGPTLRSSAGESFDDSATEAYEEGRRTLRPARDLTVVSGGADQQVQVGHRYYFQSTRNAAPSPGPVRAERLASIRDRYVRVPGYAGMLDDLRERRLLVLVGPPESGRSTTALHLLDHLTGGTVSRLDPETDLRGLDGSSIGRECGYLGEVSTSTAPPTEAQADRLADLLERQGSFCVLVAIPTPAGLRTFGAYRATSSSPPIADLLSAHLQAQLRSEDAPDAADRLIELAEEPRLRDALGPSPRPSEVAGLAGLLVAHERGRIVVDEVLAGASAFLDRRIAGWLRELQEPVRRGGTERVMRLTALRLAIAVFDGLPRHLATTAADELGDLLIQVGSPRLTPGRPLADEDDGTLLAALHAEVVDDEVRFGGVSIPAQIVRCLDRRTPAALLTHVWQRHHNLRPPIVEWLAVMGQDPQPAVRVRAAQAAGLLCSVDFSHTFPLLIEPAALAQPRRTRSEPSGRSGVDEPDDEMELRWEFRRGFAAMALDQAGLDERLTKVVDSTLRRWRRSADPALRWTAAVTMGYDIGLRSIEKTLDELRIIGTPQETEDVVDLPEPLRSQTWDLVWVAGLSIARLFANGARDVVLDYLRYWLEHPRQSLRQLALQTVVIMAGLRMSSVAERRPLGPGAADRVPDRPGGRERWPILLGLLQDDPGLAAPTAEVLRLALRSPAADFVNDAIATWIELGQSDQRFLAALIEFLPLLAVDDFDVRGLRYIVTQVRRRWADPVRADVADRVELAVSRSTSEKGASIG